MSASTTPTSDARKVETLGDHLGTEENIDLAPRHAFEDAVVRPFRTGGVEVHPRDPCFGKSQRNEMLELLRPDPAHPLCFVGAHVTDRRDRLFMAPIVTAQGRRCLVHGEGDRAARAFTHVPASRALQVGGETSAVEEQDDLIPLLEGFGSRPRPTPRSREHPALQARAAPAASR